MADLYAVFNITDPDNPVQISALMTLIEAEVEIQKMLADPFHGVTITPAEDGAVIGKLDGETIVLKPILVIPDSAA